MPQDPNKRLAIIKAADNVINFTRNFLIQFFDEGYDYRILSFSPSSIVDLQALFERETASARPQNMLTMLEEYASVEKEVIAGEYVNNIKALRTVYCGFLPRLFEAFKTDCARSHLRNCGAVTTQLAEAESSITSVCTNASSAHSAT